jgi:putative membrane protein insertion efficiency factor
VLRPALAFAVLLAVLSPLLAEEPWSISREHPITTEVEPPRHEHRAESNNPLIHFYQKYVSPLSGSTCHYTPTCSRYTGEAIRKFGLLKGMLMGTDRLIRCHPGQREHPLDVPKEY